MVRKTLTLLCALLALFAVLATSSTTFAASTKSPSEILASLQKTCAVTNVYLHGTAAPTITCARTKLSVQQSHMNPNTVTPVSCSGKNFGLYIVTRSGSACFAGSGYLGVSIATVTQVTLIASYVSSAWFLSYNPANFCTLNLNRTITNFRAHPVLITQIDLGGSKSPSYCGN